VGERHAVDANFSGPLVHFNFGDNSRHGVRSVGDGDTSAADFSAADGRRGAFPRFPVCAPGCRIEDIDNAMSAPVPLRSCRREIFVEILVSITAS